MEIHEAAVKLKLTDQSLRMWLKSGHCPFGDAWKGTGRYYQYHGMYWLGIPLDDNSKNDNFTKRKFKSFTDSLEDSNSGYHFDWDEQKFVGKQIGGLFHNVSRVYAGKEYVDTKLGAFTSVSKIHVSSRIAGISE